MTTAAPSTRPSERARIGDWMQTYTGARFYPCDPRPEDINPIDIAHHLSLQCRYNGAVTRFYSVAEHCVLMSQVVSPENALWALLHDASEAYVGDMIRPLKRSMPEFSDAENLVIRALAERFGLELNDQPWLMPDEVRAADNRIIPIERATLLKETSETWHEDSVAPLPVKIRAWGPATAERLYLKRLVELGVEL